MPIYEFECESCRNRFEELVPSGTESIACPKCGSERTRRRLSQVATPSLVPSGPKVRDDLSRRREREAARSERLAETAKRRASGDLPPIAKVQRGKSKK